MITIVKCIDCPYYEVKVYADLTTMNLCKKRNFTTDKDKSCDWWDGYLRARELYLANNCEGCPEKEKVDE